MDSYVLVVDDDEGIRESLCDILTDEGYAAIAVSNGLEALDLLRTESHPCVILLDLMMPVMDGITFRAHQLKDPALSNIPIAIITAAGVRAVSEIKAEAVLSKPLNVESVLSVVERFYSQTPDSPL